MNVTNVSITSYQFDAIVFHLSIITFSIVFLLIIYAIEFMKWHSLYKR